MSSLCVFTLRRFYGLPHVMYIFSRHGGSKTSPKTICDGFCHCPNGPDKTVGLGFAQKSYFPKPKTTKDHPNKKPFGNVQVITSDYPKHMYISLAFTLHGIRASPIAYLRVSRHHTLSSFLEVQKFVQSKLQENRPQT